MKLIFRQMLGRIYVLMILFCTGFLLMQAVRHSSWYEQRLFRQLMTGNEEAQRAAAASLAQLGAEDLLLQALKADRPNAREMAQRGLEYLWFNAAGTKAFTRLKAAHDAAEQEHYQKALALLNDLIADYPDYAEGWNRRAAVYWQLGEYEKSRADCQRALSLNPNHYGAWQGLGICQLESGDINGACHSLRAALKILPFDEVTRRSLHRCEELLHPIPADSQPIINDDLI